jgi:hypothetical protein
MSKPSRTSRMPRHRGRRPARSSARRSTGRRGGRKSSPLRSAVSTLTSYVNRAGQALPEPPAVLKRATKELRRLYDRQTTQPLKRRTRHARKGSRRTRAQKSSAR